MHSGHPCPDIGNDYFKDGITNGAHWYSVAGKATYEPRQVNLCLRAFRHDEY